MNDSYQRKYGAILAYVSIIITTIIQLLYTPFLIHKLGQSEYGLYSLVNSIIGYLTILDFGFGNAIVVYTAKYRAVNDKSSEQKLLGMFKIVFYIIGLISFVLGFILFLNVDNIFSKTMTQIELQKTKIMMLILAFNLAITFVFSIYSSIINAYEKFVFQKVISIISTILKPLVMIPLLFLGFKSITMVIIITIANLFVLLSNYIYCKIKLKSNLKYFGFDKVLFKTILGYSIWLFLTSIVDKVNWSVDNFVLGAVSGTVAVSIYSIAAQINTMFINLSTAISNVFLPKMSKMVAKKVSNSELSDEFIKVGRIQFHIIFLVLSGFILFGKYFVTIWVGDGFVESYYVTLCLICPAIFSLIQNLGLSIMQAMNKFKFKALATFFMSIVNIIISIFLAKKYGAIGAALGTTISLVVANILIMNIYYLRTIKLDIFKFWKNILFIFLKYMFASIVIIPFLYFSKFSALYNLIIFGSIYVAIYCFISYFFAMNSYEKNLVNVFVNKIRRRSNEKKIHK